MIVPDFFLFPAIGFWSVMAILVIVLTVATELDVHKIALFVLCATAFFYRQFLDAIPLSHVLGGASVYLLLGGIWSIWRWRKFCAKYITDHPYYNDDKEFRGRDRITLTAEEHYLKELRPDLHRSRILGWIFYWPCGVLWNLGGDLLVGIYELLADGYHQVVKDVIRKSARGNNSVD